MTEEEIRENIPFIQTGDILSTLSNSLSGATVMRIKRNDNSFFLKIAKLGEINLERLEKIMNIYKQGIIKSLEIIDYGIIEKHHKYYCVFNWIEGETLNNLYGKLSNNDYYYFGHQIGTDFRIINEKVPIDDSFVKKYDINDMANGAVNGFKEIYRSNPHLFNNIMSEEYINKLINKMIALSSSFYSAKKEYIHGDMHPQNIMVNDKELYIIDCEPLSIDYFAMNFRWSIGATFDYKENIAFNLGVINGFYNDKPPKDFYNQLLFTFIHKFFEYTREYYNKKDINGVINCIKKYKYIFDNLNLDDNNFLINNVELRLK